MPSYIWMCLFATTAYLLLFTAIVPLVYLATWGMRSAFEVRRVSALVVRYGISRRLLRAAWDTVSGPNSRPSRRGKAGAVVDILVVGVLTPALAFVCYWAALALAFRMATQGRASLWLVLGGAALVAGICTVGTYLYIGTGARQHAPSLPFMPVTPWVVRNQVRISAASAITRLVLLEFAIHAVFVAAFSASAIRAQRLVNESPTDTSGLLYMAGIIPLGITAAVALRLFPNLFPAAASNRLILQALAFPWDLQVVSLRSYRYPQDLTVSLRSSLRALSRSIERCAVVESRAELAAGIQYPRAVILRSIGTNLRGFLSNKASLHVTFDAIKSDLLLVMAFLNFPRSRATTHAAVQRMRPFNEDGSPKDAYLAVHQNRVSTAMSRLLVGLEKTHQGFSKLAAIVIILIGIYLFASGTVRIPEVVKLVKL